MRALSQPFIGITCDTHIPKGKEGPSRYELVCDHRYPDLVRAVGGYPVLLPISSRYRVIRRYLKEVDGVIIVGGEDVNPVLYGEKPKKGTGSVFGPRLRFEKMLYHQAQEMRLPVFGICYGMQLINVLEGGTLYQDIQRDARSKRNHRNKKRPMHRVRLDRYSYLRRIIGKDSVPVHSDHHQAVRQVAPDFRAVAYAPDHIVEAIEHRSKPLLAVQWHPERTPHHEASLRLFRSFIQLCRGNSVL